MSNDDAIGTETDTPRCPECNAPIESAEPPDANGAVRLNPCNHIVVVYRGGANV